MPVYIHNIATSVPDCSVKQSMVREKMKQYIGRDPVKRRILHRIYAKSGIKTRHTVVDDFRSDGHEKLFFKDDGSLGIPSTKTRNAIYTKHAITLFTEVAKKLLSANPSIKKQDVTHIITASCTGFFTPDPAYYIVKELELSPSAGRFHLGYMGCFAAIPALRMAHSICKADPEAAVLVVNVELCSLHLQDSEEIDQLVAASVFADGAAGAIVSAKEPAKKPAYRVENFHTSIAEHSEKDMGWIIGNTGFEMVLSTDVPNIIESNMSSSIALLLEDYDLDLSKIVHWAVHPGGRAILDRVERSLQLKPSQIDTSRNVLSKYGNMSSATVLFVLMELLDTHSESAEERTVTMAFGPGLTIESAYLMKLS
jgi:predicted naringenin-chalcone synthase